MQTTPLKSYGQLKMRKRCNLKKIITSPEDTTALSIVTFSLKTENGRYKTKKTRG